MIQNIPLISTNRKCLYTLYHSTVACQAQRQQILRKKDKLKQPPRSLLKSAAGTTTNIKSYCKPIRNQGLSQIFMANHENRKSLQFFFDFQTLELISQSLQPSQNPAEDPRGTEHSTSRLVRRRPCDLNLSSGVGEALPHINPTCGVEAELGIQITTETALDWTYWKNRIAQLATICSK